MSSSEAVPAAPLRVKLFFWLLLGMTSTALAEILSGSAPFPFTTAEGWLLVVPLYTLHAVVLLWVVHRWGAPRPVPLYLAGCLFGLYEFYITKVLWNPPWSDQPWAVAEVAVVELFVIGLFWHPFLAFMIPSFLAERLTARRQVRLPARLEGWFAGRAVIGSGAVAGALLGGAVGNPVVALAAAAVGVAVLAALATAWRRGEGPRYPLAALLPSNRQGPALVGALVLLYLVLAALLRPDAWPGLTGHLSALVLYGALTALLVVAGRRARLEPAGSPPEPMAPRAAALAVAAFVIAAPVAGLTGTLGALIVAGVWVAGGFTALVMLVVSVRYVTRRPAVSRP